MFEVLTIFCAIFVWIAYHKIFSVIYFDFGRGVIKIGLCRLLGGIVVAYLIIIFWFLGVLLIILMLSGVLKRK